MLTVEEGVEVFITVEVMTGVLTAGTVVPGRETSLAGGAREHKVRQLKNLPKACKETIEIVEKLNLLLSLFIIVCV